LLFLLRSTSLFLNPKLTPSNKTDPFQRTHRLNLVEEDVIVNNFCFTEKETENQQKEEKK